jgi:Lrp/AsnC family transcriptional regulator for asnA, asnC and gidA
MYIIAMTDTIKPVTLDSWNYKIMDKLAANARVPLSEIAAELKIATSTVHKRMQSLQDAHVIEQFTIVVDPAALNLITAFIGIEVEQDKLTKVITMLTALDEVLEVYETLEPYDLFIKVRAKGIYELKRHVVGALAQIDGVINMSSILTTVRHKEVTTRVREPGV